jgi:hypothetical protein
MFDNTVLRKVLGPKKDEAKGYWRGLHKDELRTLQSPPNVILIAN